MGFLKPVIEVKVCVAIYVSQYMKVNNLALIKYAKKLIQIILTLIC